MPASNDDGNRKHRTKSTGFQGVFTQAGSGVSVQTGTCDREHQPTTIRQPIFRKIGDAEAAVGAGIFGSRDAEAAVGAGIFARPIDVLACSLCVSVQSCSASDSLHYMVCTACSQSDKNRSMIYFAVLCRVRSNRLPAALSWTRIPTRSGRTGRVEQIALSPGPGDPGRGKALTLISFFFTSPTTSFVCLNLLLTPID